MKYHEHNNDLFLCDFVSIKRIPAVNYLIKLSFSLINFSFAN